MMVAHLMNEMSNQNTLSLTDSIKDQIAGSVTLLPGSYGVSAILGSVDGKSGAVLTLKSADVTLLEIDSLVGCVGWSPVKRFLLATTSEIKLYLHSDDGIPYIRGLEII